MAVVTPFMSLTAWSSLTDFYSNTELSANFVAIDGHDHTTGKGAQLNSNALGANSIIWSLIQPGAVQGSAGPNAANIHAGTITDTEIAPASLTSASLSANALSAATPIGTVISWFRPDQTVPIPPDWTICDGSTLLSGSHSFGVLGDVTIPDLRNSFVLGADPRDNGDTGPNNAPGENAVGGSNSQDLFHFHAIPSHTHGMSHTHTTAAHAHPISSDGTHSHQFFGFDFHTRPNTVLTGLSFFDTNGVVRNANFLSAYAGPDLGYDLTLPMDNNGAHDHSGSTGGAGAFATSDSSIDTTGATGLASAYSSPDPPTDFRPSFVGLLYIIKVN